MSQYKESILWGHNACTEGHSACDTRTEVQSQVIAVSHVTKTSYIRAQHAQRGVIQRNASMEDTCNNYRKLGA